MTATIFDATTGTELAYKELVDEQLWERLVGRLVTDEGMERSLAERIMNEALGFLQLCAKEPDGNFSPSATIDPGWHTFILYTREYDAFCRRIAGQFIHHNPTDIPGMDYSDGVTSAQTMQAMRQYGPVDDMLWASATDCNNGGTGCHGDNCSHGRCDRS